LISAFFNRPAVKNCFPAAWSQVQGICHCAPKINVREATVPFTDRVVLVGDCGVTRRAAASGCDANGGSGAGRAGRGQTHEHRVWDLFTVSAPYREVFFLTLTPRFVARFLWRSARAALSSLRRRAEEPIQA